MRLSKKLAIAAVSTVAAVGIATSAFAYFTASGTGNGSVTVGSASDWTVDGISTSGGALLPGSGTQIVSYKVTNPSAGHQSLSSAAVSVMHDANGNILAAADGAPVVGCMASWFPVDNADHALFQDYEGGASDAASASISMTNTGNQDSCQGKAPKLVINVG